MVEIFCQLCNVNVLVFHMHLHVGGKKHKARQAKETFDQEMTRTVVLQGKFSVKLINFDCFNIIIL